MRDARFLLSEDKENIPPGKRQPKKLPCYTHPNVEDDGARLDISSDEGSLSEFLPNAKKDSDNSD